MQIKLQWMLFISLKDVFSISSTFVWIKFLKNILWLCLHASLLYQYLFLINELLKLTPFSLYLIKYSIWFFYILYKNIYFISLYLSSVVFQCQIYYLIYIFSAIFFPLYYLIISSPHMVFIILSLSSFILIL